MIAPTLLAPLVTATIKLPDLSECCEARASHARAPLAHVVANLNHHRAARLEAARHAHTFAHARGRAPHALVGAHVCDGPAIAAGVRHRRARRARPLALAVRGRHPRAVRVA